MQRKIWKNGIQNERQVYTRLGRTLNTITLLKNMLERFYISNYFEYINWAFSQSRLRKHLVILGAVHNRPNLRL